MSLDRGQQDRSTAGPGRLVSGVEGRQNTKSRLDTVGAVGQITRVDIAAPANSTLYSTRFQGRNIDGTPDATTDVSATQEELRDLLIAAYENDSGVMAAAASVVAGTNQVFVNWLPRTTPPIVVSFPTNPGTVLSLVNTAATAAPQYVYGHAAEVVAGPAGNPVMLISEGIRNPVEIAGAVLGVSITFAAGQTHALVYMIDGAATTIPFASGGDADATDVLAKAALDAALPTGSTTVIDATGELTVTFTAGVAVSIVSGTATGAAAVVTVVDSAADPVPVFCLIVDEKATSRVDNGAPYQAEAIGPHPGMAPLTADQSGSNVWAVQAPAVAPSKGDAVYVEADSGSADYGALTSVPSLTTILWAGPTWVRVDPQDPNLAHVLF